jgi:hypothetical protein
MKNLVSQAVIGLFFLGLIYLLSHIIGKHPDQSYVGFTPATIESYADKLILK